MRKGRCSPARIGRIRHVEKRRSHMQRLTLFGTGVLLLGTFACPAWAGEPTKADMDFCNKKAAEVSTPSPVQPGSSTQALTAPPAGSVTPGTPVSPGPVVPPSPG